MYDKLDISSPFESNKLIENNLRMVCLIFVYYYKIDSLLF